MALVGPGGCGKSALAVRLLSRRFIADYCPVLEDTYYRVLNNGELQVECQLWFSLLTVSCPQISLEVMDTSECQGDWHHQDGRVTSCVGAARDPARWASWANVILLVYSVTSRASLTACNAFLQHCQASATPVIAVGNKNDLQMLRYIRSVQAGLRGP